MAILRPSAAPHPADAAELYAGGTTGLAVLAGRDPSAPWRRLLERAEGLGFSGALCRDPAAVAELPRLGVDRVCVVAAEREVPVALELAARGDCGALVLLSPRIADDREARALVRSIEVPRLVLAGSVPGDAEESRRFDAMSVGAIAMRFFPAPALGHHLLEGDMGPLVLESVWLFAARVLGLEAPRTHSPSLNVRKEKHR